MNQTNIVKVSSRNLFRELENYQPDMTIYGTASKGYKKLGRKGRKQPDNQKTPKKNLMSYKCPKGSKPLDNNFNIIEPQYKTKLIN